MADTETIIIIRESLVESFISDALSFASAGGLMGIGIFIGSSAMEWAGFFLFALMTFSRVSGKMKNARKTPQEAADYLLAEFKVRAL